jgi:PIN domain nuclease of toxin-antitoxin system
MMRLLLDTQAYLWHVTDSQNLSQKAKELILNAESIHISTVSLWEVALKVRLGKLNANLDRSIATMELSGFHELPVFSRHAAHVARLPLHHGDPFDRMLIAQAIAEDLYLVTSDRHLSQYSDLVILI